jgi:hypothetical protein
MVFILPDAGWPVGGFYRFGASDTRLLAKIINPVFGSQIRKAITTG